MVMKMKNSDVKQIENIYSRTDVFDIRWRVTTLCNYQCDFCIQGNREEHLRQAQGESSDLRNRICDAVISLIEGFEGYKRVKIGLIGGEVSIIKEFPDILKRLAQCNFSGEIRFSITTNFSADVTWFYNLIDQFKQGAGHRKRSLSISASFYPEYVSIEQFGEKLRDISLYSGVRKHKKWMSGILKRFGSDKGGKISISAGIPIIDDMDYEMLVNTKTAFQDTGVRVFPIIIRNYDTSLSDRNLKQLIKRENKLLKVTDINDKTMLFPTIQSLGAALDNTDTFCPTGYLCDAGIRNIWIDAFGNVKRCPTIGRAMPMGSILDGTFKLYDGPRPCISDHCSCGVYGKIKKVSQDMQ